MGNRIRGLLIGTLAAIGLILASCGADSSQETAETAPPNTDNQTAVTTASTSADSATATTAESVSEPQGSPAPDFTLDLSGGGTFVLSEQTTPVVIFFWAEW